MKDPLRLPLPSSRSARILAILLPKDFKQSKRFITTSYCEAIGSAVIVATLNQAILLQFFTLRTREDCTVNSVAAAMIDEKKLDAVIAGLDLVLSSLQTSLNTYSTHTTIIGWDFEGFEFLAATQLHLDDNEKS